MSHATRRPMTPEDLFRLRLVSDPQLAPDGERVVYVLQRADAEKNKYFTQLWLVNADGSGNRPFTADEHGDSMPRWSPGGRSVAFVSDRDERAQLWLIPVDGGEARPLTKLEEGSIAEFRWSPDGTRIAFNYRPKPAWMRKSECEAREKAKRSTPPLEVHRLAYREEGRGYFGDERWHLHVLEVASARVTQLTTGSTDQGSFAWSPDGARIAFVTNRSQDPDRTPERQELRVVPAAGGEESRIETALGPKHNLTWSPDGRWLAFYGNTDIRGAWSATDPHLWIVPAEGGEGRDLGAALDRPAGDATLADLRSFGGGWTGPVWAPNSRRLYFLASDRGACHLYRAHLEDGRLENLTPGFQGEISAVSIDAADTRVATITGHAHSPGEVHVGSTPVTQANAELLAELELAAVEEFTAPSPEGEVHGWLMRPTSGNEPAPLVLYIHGGPHTQYGWSMLHEFQVLAGRGFAVLYTNPRGSRGYSQAHVSAIRGDWGGADYRDLMAAVDHAVTLPGIDPGRVGVTGGSYGGYMTNWMIGHTDRFRCAVTQRSVVNLHSMGGTCDFAFAESDYFGGNTWSEPEKLWKQSPLKYVGAVKTPLLILHSEGDLRCPIEQAEQLYAALKMQGKEVEFVRYPREANHGLSRTGPPDLRLDRMGRIVAWMERWLK